HQLQRSLRVSGAAEAVQRDRARVLSVSAAMSDDQWIDVNGLRTRYRDAGQGERVVVLIHGGLFNQSGLCMSSAVWDSVLPYLAGDVQVYALDTLGQGRNDPPRGDDGYTIASMIEHLKGFIEAIGANRPHLVGHDEGAMLAVPLWIRAGSRHVASWTAR